MKQNATFWILFTLYMAGTCRIAWMAYHDPHHNWDTLVYMALVLGFEKEDPTEIHREVYGEFEKAISEEAFNSHTNPADTVFAGKVLKDHTAFFHFASLFKSKLLYNLAARLAYKAGAPLVKAPLIPSVLSFIGISILLIYWLQNFLPAAFAFIAAGSVVLSGPLIEVARLSTPDAMSALALLVAFYLLFSRVKWYWMAIALTVAILTRLDNLIIACLIWLLLKAAPGSTGIVSRPSLISFLLIVIFWMVYAWIILDYSNYGNSSVDFYNKLMEKVNPVVMLGDVIRGLPTLQHSSLSIAAAVAAVVLFYDGNFNRKTLRLTQCVFIALVLQVLIKYLLFPVLWDRLYVATFIVLLVVILKEFVSRMTKLEEKTRW